MKTRNLVVLATLLLAGCITDHDRDHDRSKGEERARKYCVQEAKSRGLHVEDVGRIEKVGKKQYEVKLHIDAGKQKDKNDKKQKSADYSVLCRYDDKSRSAQVH